MRIGSLDELVSAAQRGGPVRIGVVAADDPEVLKAVGQAQSEGFAEAVLVGNWPAIEAYAAQTGVDLAGMELFHEPSPRKAAEVIVAKARAGEIDVVVKGQIKTADLLGACLNRHIGIRDRGLLSHVALFELPGLGRLLYLSDSGVVIAPDVYQKLEIIQNAVAVAHRLGLACPRVAILAASETVHPKIPASIDGLALARMADQGWVDGAMVDGPMGLETAISPQVAQIEGSRSPIAGQADVVIVPNVESGNIVAKGLLYFAKARMAGLVVGAQKPIIISSRADSAETRYLSLAMAAVLARTGEAKAGSAGRT
ncbi:MAG TPA: bifunctional enoyl-CoA hydratase/phosphate acetyltransferase [Anaerolineae bacterium]|nr:bifunctional enoyl-CoA hydratase/phosphate acetyltransferase [Anaerolineae bacterium]